MKPATCNRLFEAEALRDGRLNGPERASFERHTTLCTTCAREVQALAALAEALRTTTAEPIDELHTRRARGRLLAAFNGELLALDAAPVVRHRLIWSLVSMALMATVVVAWRVHPGREPPAQVEVSRALVHPDPTTVWSERVEGDREVIVLESGALWIRVVHAASPRRLVVALPDGELEDTGTTFTVAAENGHTTRVAVQEGSVVLRVRGEAPVTIGSGDQWRPTAPTPPSCDASATSAQPPPNAPPPPPRPSAQPLRIPGSVVTALASEPSADFRAAMSALDRGDNQEAAAGFADFLVKHPQDPRTQDAAYLRVIAFQRSGDRSAMKRAAVEYLRRCPAGFRRAEAERLSQ